MGDRIRFLDVMEDKCMYVFKYLGIHLNFTPLSLPYLLM